MATLVLPVRVRDCRTRQRPKQNDPTNLNWWDPLIGWAVRTFGLGSIHFRQMTPKRTCVSLRKPWFQGFRRSHFPKEGSSVSGVWEGRYQRNRRMPTTRRTSAPQFCQTNPSTLTLRMSCRTRPKARKNQPPWMNLLILSPLASCKNLLVRQRPGPQRRRFQQRLRGPFGAWL